MSLGLHTRNSSRTKFAFDRENIGVDCKYEKCIGLAGNIMKFVPFIAPLDSRNQVSERSEDCAKRLFVARLQCAMDGKMIIKTHCFNHQENRDGY